MCNWYVTCGGAQGTVCGTPAGAGEGCENVGAGCKECFRGDFNFALPLKDQEPSRPTYWKGHFNDGLFILASARGLARFGLRRGDALLKINGRAVTPALLRNLHKKTPAEVEVVASRHRNRRAPEVVTFRAGRKR